ncbi:MAG: AraC family transcriptional regulator [Caldilineaceae bacterium]
MEATNHWSSACEAKRVEASHEEFSARLAQVARRDGVVEPVAGLTIHRASAPTGLAHGVSFPSFCLVAQGSKEVLLGDNCYQYDPAHYLIATVALPYAAWIKEASPERPYLGFVLRLDAMMIGSVLAEVGHVAQQQQAPVTAIDVRPLDVDLLDAAVRLVRLLESPTDVRVLAPPLMREIVYRLLRDGQSERLHQIAVLGGNNYRIAEALEWLRKDFDQPLRIEEIARGLGMSISSFNHHFRTLTAMSPLQFQKQLRLQEARRLMLSNGLDAKSAGYCVGYNDASHFNREYKRLFGQPPLRDMERLREASTLAAN